MVFDLSDKVGRVDVEYVRNRLNTLTIGLKKLTNTHNPMKSVRCSLGIKVIFKVRDKLRRKI